MNEDLKQFREKIESYDQDQLEEVLVTLNKLKFPDKFEIVKEVLAQKTGRGLKEEQLETVSQSSSEVEKENEDITDKDEVSSVKPYDYSKHVVASSAKKKSQSLDTPVTPQTSSLLVILVFVTSLIAVYVILQTSVSLPGKSVITKLANKFFISEIKEPDKIPAPVKSSSVDNS